MKNLVEGMVSLVQVVCRCDIYETLYLLISANLINLYMVSWWTCVSPSWTAFAPQDPILSWVLEASYFRVYTYYSY